MLLLCMIFMILSLIGKRRTCIHLFLLNSIDGMMVTALVVEPMTNPSRNMVHSHIEMPPVQRGLSPYEYFKINQNPSPIWTQLSDHQEKKAKGIQEEIDLVQSQLERTV